MELAEREQLSRHHLQATTIIGSIDTARRGQQYGLVIAVIVLVFATILILVGHEVPGTIIASVDVVSLVGVFVYGRAASSRAEQDRQGKQKPSGRAAH